MEKCAISGKVYMDQKAFSNFFLQARYYWLRSSRNKIVRAENFPLLSERLVENNH